MGSLSKSSMFHFIILYFIIDFIIEDFCFLPFVKFVDRLSMDPAEFCVFVFCHFAEHVYELRVVECSGSVI